MLFFLVGANGRPIWWSSAVPAAFISLCLIGSRGPEQVIQQALSKTNGPIFWCLLALTACTALSAGAVMEIETGQTFLLRSLIPLMIYFSVVGLRLRAADIGVCVLAIMAGSSIPLVSGLIAFFREGSSPDLTDLLFARYDLSRMAEYMNVTFGNVGHVGMYALLIAPGVFVATSAGVLRGIGAGLWTVWLCVVLANLVVSGSRTAFAMSLAVAGLLSFTLYKGRTVTMCGLVLIVCGTLLMSADVVDESLIIERVLPSMGANARDNSLDERAESIQIGWETFTANAAVGIGPGRSPAYNPHGVPHQSVLMVASETGLFGGLSFLFLNIVVLIRSAKHAWRARRSEVDRLRLIWLVGPATWLVGGFLAGLTFNMGPALLWVGILYAMLGLYGFQDAPQKEARGH
jgi:O-antigen ligase/polysaccharide polymerase Wzy-like membrane protein